MHAPVNLELSHVRLHLCWLLVWSGRPYSSFGFIRSFCGFSLIVLASTKAKQGYLKLADGESHNRPGRGSSRYEFHRPQYRRFIDSFIDQSLVEYRAFVWGEVACMATTIFSVLVSSHSSASLPSPYPRQLRAADSSITPTRTGVDLVSNGFSKVKLAPTPAPARYPQKTAPSLLGAPRSLCGCCGRLSVRELAAALSASQLLVAQLMS